MNANSERTRRSTIPDLIIDLSQVVHRYGAGRGLDGLNLRVARGARCGFLGPNGAGKTTTMRILMGFLRAERGLATVFGQDCWRESPRIKRQVGYLPGDVRLGPGLTAREGLGLLGALFGRDVRRHGEALCERFGLDALLPAARMSRGTRQKLGLVLALAPQAPLLILDEPTTALDPLVQTRLLEYLRARSEGGDTLLFSSHTLSEVAQLCDQVTLVRDGRVAADTTVDALARQARRVVRVVFHTEAQATIETVPPFLAISARGLRHWEVTLEGAPIALLQWGAARDLADCHIGPPDLERVFHGFYDASVSWDGAGDSQGGAEGRA